MTNIDEVLRWADSSLILGQRLTEWCAHAPELELEMAVANIALDLIGQARLLLSYAGELEGRGRDEDQLAFHRDALDYRNVLLVEQENGDWAVTIVRQFLFSTFQRLKFRSLATGPDSCLAEIAEKSLKEIDYHCRFARDWMLRLGDGTPESHAHATDALELLWRYVDDLFDGAEELRAAWDSEINSVLAQATLKRPAPRRGVTGARKGHHTEALGHLLAEMQHLQRSYPGLTW
jgi:ring-1,2-phenylacetyl-CoA epoxidase subunit PaaC